MHKKSPATKKHANTTAIGTVISMISGEVSDCTDIVVPLVAGGVVMMDDVFPTDVVVVDKTGLPRVAFQVKNLNVVERPCPA